MASENMPFMGHLSELRKRLVISVVVVFIGFLVSFTYSEFLFKMLVFPMHSGISFKTAYPYVYIVTRDIDSSLVFLGPAEAFWAHMKIAMIFAIIATSPILFFELWRFMAPGFHEKEKKMAVPFLLVTTGLFIFGTLFCFIIVLPFAMKFLLTYKTESLTPMIAVGRYIDFCLKFILAFGIVFELPVVLVFLTRLGVVTPKTLAKNRKYAVLLAFVAAAILTPTPDAFNQVLMAVPIIFLYEGGIIASRIFIRRSRGADKREKPKSDSA
jgi:sec-independent protein translocase protein TatC